MKAVFTALFILMATMAWAGDFGLIMSEGRAALDAGDYAKAESAFRAALSDQPQSAEAELYLGIALSRKGDKAAYKEAESHLKHALKASPKDPLTNYELGTLFYKRAVPEEAEDFFENVLLYAPSGSLAAKAEEQLKAIRGATSGAESEKSWAIGIGTGVQYDSNVALKTRYGLLPEGVSHQEDWRTIYTMAGGYRFLSNSLATGSIGYSFYQSLHSDLSEYDIQAHTLRLGFTRELAKDIKGGITGSYDYLTMGAEQYSRSGGVMASVLALEGEGLSTQLEAKYAYNDCYNVRVFQSNKDSSGNNYAFSISQAVPVGRHIGARAGYEWSALEARKSISSYSSNKGFMELNIAMPMDMALIITGDFEVKAYAASADTDNNHTDRLLGCSASIRRDMLDWLSAEVGFSYADNESNVKSYDYTRAITSVLLKARF